MVEGTCAEDHVSESSFPVSIQIYVLGTSSLIFVPVGPDHIWLVSTLVTTANSVC